MKADHAMASGQQVRRDFTIFTDTQVAMSRIENDYPGPGQDMAVKVPDLASCYTGRATP